VSFTDTSTGSPTSWSWSFGDGTSSTVQNPSKTYAAAGTYTVSLTASNSVDSDTATAAGYITVNNPASITRQGTSTTVNTTATPSINIAKPSGTVAGDVLVSCLASNGTKVAATGIPAGWTQIAAVLQGTSTRAFGYYKVAGPSEPASYTWTLNASVASSGGIARYSGVSATTPLDGTPQSASGASATSGTVPSVTTSTANAMLVGCMSIDSSATTVTITPPTGLTQVWNLAGKRQECADGVQTTAGPSGAKTWTFSGSREWAGWLVALKPG
jgi:PKD repeat protein